MKKYIIPAIIAFYAFGIINAITTPKTSKEDFEPTSVWEHYCIMDLDKLPSEATEEEFDYFLDVFSETDEYQELYEIYNQ